MEQGESPRNPFNPATYTETFPLFSTQSPGLEQKNDMDTPATPTKKLNNAINAAPTKHRQRRRGCASCSALVERMHRIGS